MAQTQRSVLLRVDVIGAQIFFSFFPAQQKMSQTEIPMKQAKSAMVLDNVPMQIQDKAKGKQAKYAERVDRPK